MLKFDFVFLVPKEHQRGFVLFWRGFFFSVWRQKMKSGFDQKCRCSWPKTSVKGLTSAVLPRGQNLLASHPNLRVLDGSMEQHFKGRAGDTQMFRNRALFNSSSDVMSFTDQLEWFYGRGSDQLEQERQKKQTVNEDVHVELFKQSTLENVPFSSERWSIS